MGYFNARTHNKNNFMDEDELFCRKFDYDKDLIDHFQNTDILDQYNLLEVRNSQYKFINNEGNMLIDTCKLNNLFILNWQ